MHTIIGSIIFLGVCFAFYRFMTAKSKPPMPTKEQQAQEPTKKA